MWKLQKKILSILPGSVLIPDVAYGSHPDQIMDIYLPSNDTTRVSKVAVLIHGGSWDSGDKGQMAEVVEFLETFFPEICIVNINFRHGNLNHLNNNHKTSWRNYIFSAFLEFHCKKLSPPSSAHFVKYHFRNIFFIQNSFNLTIKKFFIIHFLFIYFISNSPY